MVPPRVGRQQAKDQHQWQPHNLMPKFIGSHTETRMLNQDVEWFMLFDGVSWCFMVFNDVYVWYTKLNGVWWCLMLGNAWLCLIYLMIFDGVLPCSVIIKNVDWCFMMVDVVWWCLIVLGDARRCFMVGSWSIFVSDDWCCLMMLNRAWWYSKMIEDRLPICVCWFSMMVDGGICWCSMMTDGVWCKWLIMSDSFWCRSDFDPFFLFPELEIQTSPRLSGLSCRHNTLGWSLSCLGRKELWDGWIQLLYPQFPDRLAWLMGLEFFGWAESCSASAGWNCRMKSHSAGTSPIFTTSWGTHLISSSNATACLSAPNHWRGWVGLNLFIGLLAQQLAENQHWQSTAQDFSPSRVFCIQFILWLGT